MIDLVVEAAIGVTEDGEYQFAPDDAESILDLDDAGRVLFVIFSRLCQEPGYYDEHLDWFRDHYAGQKH